MRGLIGFRIVMSLRIDITGEESSAAMSFPLESSGLVLLDFYGSLKHLSDCLATW